MTTPTHDLIAINDRGVYAICYDMPGDDYVAEFTRAALAAGHRVERVTTKEACERHLAYLRTLPGFREVLPPTPSHSPSGMGGARGG